jgi:hypothetical protein
MRKPRYFVRKTEVRVGKSDGKGNPTRPKKCLKTVTSTRAYLWGTFGTIYGSFLVTLADILEHFASQKATQDPSRTHRKLCIALERSYKRSRGTLEPQGWDPLPPQGAAAA